jgi:hypothetical protein
LLRAGLENEIARTKAIALFKICLDRGWPVYEEGLQLLQEAGSLLRHIADRRDAEYFAKVEELATAKAWAGATLSFYGKEPSKPSAVLWVGMPNAPRRRRLAQPECLMEMIEKNRQVIEDPNQMNASMVSRQMSSLSFSQELVPQRRVVKDSQSSHRLTSLQDRKKPLGIDLDFNLAISEIKQTNESRAMKKKGDWLLLRDIGD